ncbi:hypothetical protein MRX96_047883 [Rhipicephalus microplus]|uniref:Uncharacterized protein n=1 Tax=Rhipicephalus microplus TaxID=6941 RepID=A0A9J6F7Y6_RHIMP|nr:hypothetical protein HPB51_021383 [Rhipicephalus microplus]
METIKTCSDGSRLSPKKPVVLKKQTLRSPGHRSSKSASVTLCPEDVLADRPVRDHTLTTDEPSTSPRRRSTSPVVRYNAVEKPVGLRDNGPAALTSREASTVGSDPEWAGTDAVLIDENMAATERLGKAFPRSGARRRKRRLWNQHVDADGMSTARVVRIIYVDKPVI